MPLIEVKISDLERLIGKGIPTNELERYITSLKGEIEKIEEDTLEYEATHDRPDLFSAEGLARAIKGLMKLELGIRKFPIKEGNIRIMVEEVPYRPFIACAVVRNVQLGEEALRQLMQLQEKLHLTYGRNRRKASIGLYDLDTITPPIYYKAISKERIRFIPLDMNKEMSADEILHNHPKGIEYREILLGKHRYPLLFDSEGKVLSMPPIINSEDTKVSVRTRNVFIDVTGTDINAVLGILTIMTTSVVERASGGYIETVIISYPSETIISPILKEEKVNLSTSYANKILGLSLSPDEICEYLLMMRFNAEVLSQDEVKVTVPCYRMDILHPIDLVEEVAMAYGFDNLIPELPEDHVTIGKVNPIELFSQKIREIMAGLGFQEVANYMMSNKEILLKRMRLKSTPLVEVKNPVSERFSALRNWLLPGLLYVLSMSKGCGYPQRIFEVGDVALIDLSLENRVKEERHLAAVIASSKVTLVDALVILDALARTLGVTFKYITPEKVHPSFIEGRYGKIFLNTKEIGFVGEVHPEVLLNFNLEVPVTAFEIRLDTLFNEYIKYVLS